MKIMVLGGIAESLVTFRGPLLKEMVSRRHQVLACAPNASENIQLTLDQIGVEYQDVNIDRVGMNPLRDISTVIELSNIVKRYKPDVVLAYTIKPAIYGSIAARIQGVERIFTMIEGLGYAFMNNSFKSKVLGFIASGLYKVAVGFNKKVFFLNPDNLQIFQDKGLVYEDQAVMINGIGVDLKKFNVTPFPTKPVFIMIARLLVDKGVREYVKAAEIVKMHYPEARFLLVGWWDEHNPASIKRDELDVYIDGGFIEHLGHLDDVRPALASSSVYVLPSYHEGLPVTVMEAMAMGRPIITTDAPGCRETVKDGVNGFLVPVQDVQSLVEAAKFFIRHPESVNSMGSASRKMAEEKFDVNTINRVMLEAMEI